MAFSEEAYAHADGDFSQLMALLQAEHNRQVEGLRSEISALHALIERTSTAERVEDETGSDHNTGLSQPTECTSPTINAHQDARQLDAEATQRPLASLESDAVHSASPVAMEHEQSQLRRSRRSPTLSADRHQNFAQKLRSRGVIQPANGAYILWCSVTSLVVVVCVWADLLSLVDSFPGGFGPLGVDWEIFLTYFFAFDIILTFNVAVEHEHLNLWVKDRCVIAQHYLKTWFLLDVMTSIPWTLILRSNMGSGSGARSARLLKIGKTLKSFRLAKLFKQFASHDFVETISDKVDIWCSYVFSEDASLVFQQIARFSVAVFKVLLLMFLESFVLVCILLANHKSSDLRWSFASLDAEDLSAWKRYAVTTFWTVKSVATGPTESEDLVFTGSASAALTLKVITACLYAMNLVCIVAFFANLQGSDDMDLEYKIKLLKIHLRKLDNVTTTTRKQILNYFRAQQTVLKQKGLHQMIEVDLSINLRAALFIEMYGDVLNSFRMFHQHPFVTENFEFAKRCCQIVKAEFFPPLQQFLSTSINPACMYVLIYGAVGTRGCRKSGGKVFQYGKFYAVECIFSPPGTDMHPEKDLFTLQGSKFGKVSRKDFDKMIESADFPAECASFITFLRSKVGEGAVAASGLPEGVDPDLVQEWQEHLDASHEIASHDHLGIACHYLLYQFKFDLEAELGPCTFSTKSFNELSEHFWTGGVHRGFRGSADMRCPCDGMKGSSIVHALEMHERDPATVFISWCWYYTVDVLVSSLGAWAAAHKLDRKRIFFWVCFFCNNQRKLLINKVAEDFVTSFGQKLQAIGRMVMVFDKYDYPGYISRIWCIYEAFEATKLPVLPDVAMPPSCQEELYKQITHGNFHSIRKSLMAISVENATSTYPWDKERILELIQTSGGFQAVNETVKCALMTWLATAFQKCLRKLTTSETARAVGGLIKEGDGNLSRVPLEFGYFDWKRALQRHPGLLDFFGFDDSLPPEDTFGLLHNGGSDPSQRVNLEMLSSFLEQRQKNSIRALTLWLRRWVDKDSSLKAVIDDVKAMVQDEERALKDELQDREQVLELCSSIRQITLV